MSQTNLKGVDEPEDRAIRPHGAEEDPMLFEAVACQ